VTTGGGVGQETSGQAGEEEATRECVRVVEGRVKLREVEGHAHDTTDLRIRVAREAGAAGTSAAPVARDVHSRGLHSFTCQLNLSFCVWDRGCGWGLCSP